MCILDVLTSNSNRNAQILRIVSRCFFIGDTATILLSSFWYCSFTARTFNEFVEAFFFVIHTCLLMTWYQVFLSQRFKYTQLMTEIDATIGKSKKSYASNQLILSHRNIVSNQFRILSGRASTMSAMIYKKADDEIAKMANKARFIIFWIIAPNFACPAILETTYKHFTSNHSNDSFKQIVPAT